MLCDESQIELPTVVKLNVGGTPYATKLTTLQKYPESMLGAMFSGRYKMEVDENGRYFIDRDGEFFKHILEFLRDENYLPPSSCIESVFREADYYALTELSLKLLDLPPLYPFGAHLNREDPIENYGEVKKNLLALSRKKAKFQAKVTVYLLCMNSVNPGNTESSLKATDFILP